MVAGLVRSNTGNSYSLVNDKRYDAWGKATQSSGPGDALANPAEGYCGNLGHKFDPESELIYMRARYYEPGSGRFISEDPAMDGDNWFIFCGNDPVQRLDPDGKTWRESVDKMLQVLLWIAWFFSGGDGTMPRPPKIENKADKIAREMDRRRRKPGAEQNADEFVVDLILGYQLQTLAILIGITGLKRASAALVAAGLEAQLSATLGASGGF